LEKAAVKVTALPYVDGEPEVDRANVGTAAFRLKAKISEMLPSLAVRVAVCVVPTAETVAVKPALVALAGTVTVAGTVTAALLLDKFTLRPALGAAAFSVTVQASVPVPVMDALLQDSDFSSPIPVPVRLPVSGLLGALVVTVSEPAAIAPRAVGVRVIPIVQLVRPPSEPWLGHVVDGARA